MNSNSDFIHFSATFRKVCKSPDTYTVCGTIREVLAFLSGLYIGLYRLPVDSVEETGNEVESSDPMERFNVWLAQKDRCMQSSDWSRTAYSVLKVYDDDEALEYLVRLFNEYIREQMGMTLDSGQSQLF